MKSNSYRKHDKARRTLNLTWFSLTILLLAIVLFLQWQNYRLLQQQQLQLDANELSVKLDNLLDPIFHSIYSLPLYGQEIKNCQSDLMPILSTLSFNNPFISASVISDNNNKVICSTFNFFPKLPKPPERTPFLYGPLLIDSSRAPAFLLQQRLGKYYLGVYILQKVFADILKSVSFHDKLIILVDNNRMKNLLEIGNKSLLIHTAYSHSQSTASANLQSIANIKILIVGSPIKPNINFLYEELPFLLVISLVSLLIYFKFRWILNNRYSLHYALSNALKQNHFQPAYQPIRDHFGNRFCGAEILLRWQTDSNEIIMPDSFIGDAERSGLIVPITLQLIAKTFHQMHSFLKRHRHFYLSFNLSANHFSDKDFFIQFYELCMDFKIPPQQLMLELTERELLDQNNTDIVAKMHDLRAKGYSLAIDDFGTGHASIQYLQHFPFNYLKIDRIFVQAIGTGAITETLNQAIIHLAHHMELNIIAEGVETEEQFKFLLKNRINFMQGWYFAKALSYERLVQMIEGESG
ncbi:EAL domain-containing protein [Legionella micdadei]|uniref:EAL domain-containing protein n=1 Tax=Legionella micdadei TaxID=451 RepID=A0A098GEI4_LEGMI|nr:EAL domain-containing protein [Legionella micdadei]ARG97544.1 EAL domain-containing protein [Legionella micdadei]KTD27621.1 Rtn protein [Legionella micdadei]CEG60893.1 conserved exported protein of unknown function [Legionella micdadei]SCY16426.1 EAL domain-containing protein [Legionella micdadei]